MRLWYQVAHLGATIFASVANQSTDRGRCVECDVLVIGATARCQCLHIQALFDFNHERAANTPFLRQSLIFHYFRKPLSFFAAVCRFCIESRLSEGHRSPFTFYFSFRHTTCVTLYLHLLMGKKWRRGHRNLAVSCGND